MFTSEIQSKHSANAIVYLMITKFEHLLFITVGIIVLCPQSEPEEGENEWPEIPVSLRKQHAFSHIEIQFVLCFYFEINRLF